MTRILDERFLTVHPRTQLWWEQREKCNACAWQVERPLKATGRGNTSGSGGGVHCLAVPAGRYGVEVPCISARDLGSPCGPDANLYKPAPVVTKST